MTTPILEAALLYASRGWPVFPCHPNAKVPIVQRGFYSASTDPDVVREMFSRPANVAIVTGQASGFYVVDIDDPSSPFVASLPPTLVASTPRGGWHYYYRTAAPLKSSVNKLAHKIDTRGDGGYVVAPPSVVDGRVYQWANNLDAAMLPQFVIDALAKADPPTVPARREPVSIVLARGTTPYGMRALMEECDALRAAEEGTRNNALNRASFKVAQLVAGGNVDEGEARAHLIDAALACGLEERETERTIDSGFRGGLAHPRVPSQRPDPLDGMSFVDGEHERPPANTRRKRKDHQDAAQWELLSRVMSLGGLAQSFPEWVINTARYPQPGLTIGATIALGSVLGARRYVFRGLTSSSYICAVANTGGGKGHPQTCLTSLLRGHWSGVIGPSDLSSTASTIERIGTAAAAGTGILFVLDEYGPRLKTLLDAHSSHQRETRALLLSLATIGTGDYAAATSLARGGDDKIIRVPGLSIYGSSTPQSLHDAIGRMALDDGLTGRHLFFNELNTLPTRARGVTSEPPPEDLVAFLDSIRDAHVAWDKSLPREGSSADGMPIPIYRADTIMVDDDAARLLDDYSDAQDAARRSGDDGPVPAQVLARCAEHATRVAACLAVLSTQPGRVATVTADVVHAACSVVDSCADTLATSLRTYAAESDHHKVRLRVMAALGDGPLSRREVLSRLPASKRAEIIEVIDRLVLEGLVGGEGSGADAMIWIAERST